MWGNKNLPVFGQLSGVKVVAVVASVAGPLTAGYLADMGADVLWLENALAPDQTRFSFDYKLESERRNMRNLGLSLATPEAKEVLKKLLKDADVFVESGKGGQYEKWGLSDEVLWEINPRLVIAHLSGYGQTGDAAYVSRPSYDPVAQAFSGYTWCNANPETPPYALGMAAGDYVPALFNTMGIVAALYRVRATGVGESVDCAQYECMLRIQPQAASYFTDHRDVYQAGCPTWVAGVGTYRCKDGEYIQLVVADAPSVEKAVRLFGLEYGGREFPEGITRVRKGEPGFETFTDAINAYLSIRTVREAQAELVEAGILAQKVNDLADMESEPQIHTRNFIQELTSVKGARVRYFDIIPKFKNHPGRTWRTCPYQGEHNEEVLTALGYSASEIESFYERRIIAKDAEMKYVYPYKVPGQG